MIKYNAVALASTFALAGSLVASTCCAGDRSAVFASECAMREVGVISAIEDHGNAGDVASDRLAEAAFKMLDARRTCYAGRVHEALASYDEIIPYITTYAGAAPSETTAVTGSTNAKDHSTYEPALQRACLAVEADVRDCGCAVRVLGRHLGPEQTEILFKLWAAQTESPDRQAFVVLQRQYGLPALLNTSFRYHFIEQEFIHECRPGEIIANSEIYLFEPNSGIHGSTTGQREQ